MIRTLILIFFLVSSSQYTQSLIFEEEIGAFKDAGAFFITANDFIYVTDLAENEVYKLDMQGMVLDFIGGYGWTESAFDGPVDIYANTLNVYVTDRNNDRIQIFDKDLNFLSIFESDDITNPDYRFAYPVSGGISSIGDLFILDSDNSRVLKYNLRGDFLLEIGNYDAGEFALSNPVKLAIARDSKLFVLDRKQVFIFDQFGGGLTKLNLDFEPTNMNITSGILSINNKKELKLLNLSDTNKGFMKLGNFLSSDIVEAAIYKEKLFILTQNDIKIYKLSIN